MVFKKGCIPWNKGIKVKYSEEALQKMIEARKGKPSWNKGIKGIHFSPKTEFYKGYKHSEETKKKMIEARKGNKHWAWKGGISTLISKIRSNFKYRQWRSDIFTKNDFTCQECGQRGGSLNAHHIKRISSILQYYEIATLEEALGCEELWNINNGITFCKECHKKLHRLKLNNEGVIPPLKF